jgi:hypothetical protein
MGNSYSTPKEKTFESQHHAHTKHHHSFFVHPRRSGKVKLATIVGAFTHIYLPAREDDALAVVREGVVEDDSRQDVSALTGDCSIQSLMNSGFARQLLAMTKPDARRLAAGQFHIINNHLPRFAVLVGRF